MATNPFHLSNAGLPLFNIYNDASPVSHAPPPRAFPLPGGPCNYGDMRAGPNSLRCGCQRFWARPATDANDDGNCMCGHHACFHRDAMSSSRNDDDVAARYTQQHGGLGQENERPRTGATRPPLSPVVDLSLQMPPPALGVAATHDSHLPIYPVDDALSFIYNDYPQGLTTQGTLENLMEDTQRPALHQPTPQPPHSSIPDTLPWGGTPASQASILQKPAMGLSPGRPSSQATSTTSSARFRYQRPFAGRGLNTLTTSGLSKPMSPPPPPSRRDSQSATFGRQPPHPASIAGPEDIPDDDTQPEPRVQDLDAATDVTRQEFNNVSDTVASHEQRLGRLESASFSASAAAGGHDECDERHDHGDLRMTDIESRMDEVEKTNIEHGALLARLTADKNDDAVTSQSAASFSTTGSTSRPTHSQELYSEVQSLRDTVLSMQSTLATPSHPWEIEVVFLPFPLKKLWQGIEHFKPDSATGLASDEWTQTGAPMSLNTSAMGLGAYHNHSPLYDEWSRDTAGGNRHDAAVPAEWLLPRAYPDSSPAGSRLRSRGLVRMVQMRGPDARSVQQAMVAAFGDVLRQMEAASQLNGSDRWAPSSNEYSRLSRRYAGLQSLWVPLRKVHKDSRLRLLSPAEMLNPTSWTVEFLSSVMMKRKTAASRLYVTSPEAYVQDMHAYERGWTWQRIRELSRVPNPDEEDNEDGSTNASANGDGVPEADALESCWARDEQLDDVPGAPPALASLNMRLQRRATTSSPSLRHMSLLGASSSRRSSSPVVLGPVVRERRSMRHSPMPVSIAAGGRHVSPALSGATRRRVSYAASGRHVSPSVSQQQQQQMAALRRRRRRTRSPSYPAFTPRMTASPSPGPVPAALRQQQRATTPFAYATPHSNVAPLQEIRLVGQHSSRNRAGSADFGVAVDELHDIDIYADEPDAYYGAYSDDEDDEDYSLHERQLPEDEPWPGIEDQQRQAAADDMSVSEEEDGENVDPGAAGSDASSLPSEYPSHGPWPEADEGFRIHEDE